jgi:hypothetical protein
MQIKYWTSNFSCNYVSNYFFNTINFGYGLTITILQLLQDKKIYPQIQLQLCDELMK